MSSITITDYATNSITINPVNFGWISSIHLSLHIQERSNGTFGIWDDGASYDYRTCKVVWQLNATQASQLLETFRDANKSRAYSVNLILSTGCGFYPFGPDKGDSGTFQVRLIGIEPRGTSNSIWQYHTIECEFIAESFPAYAIPAQQTKDIEGSLQIGTITGLRFPPEFTTPKSVYAYNSAIARDGTTYDIDQTDTADQYTTEMNMVQNQVNSARLINHIVDTVRGSTVNIIPPANSYIFGREKGDTSTYSCKLINNMIEISCPLYNRFIFRLNFYRVSG